MDGEIFCESKNGSKFLFYIKVECFEKPKINNKTTLTIFR